VIIPLVGLELVVSEQQCDETRVERDIPQMSRNPPFGSGIGRHGVGRSLAANSRVNL
jgi:hypothetical protein